MTAPIELHEKVTPITTWSFALKKAQSWDNSCFTSISIVFSQLLVPAIYTPRSGLKCIKSFPSWVQQLSEWLFQLNINHHVPPLSIVYVAHITLPPLSFVKHRLCSVWLDKVSGFSFHCLWTLCRFHFIVWSPSYCFSILQHPQKKLANKVIASCNILFSFTVYHP